MDSSTNKKKHIKGKNMKASLFFFDIGKKKNSLKYKFFFDELKNSLLEKKLIIALTFSKYGFGIVNEEDFQ
jgi:hypothetical protein